MENESQDMHITEIREETKSKILRKSVDPLPNNPSERGYSAQEIKKAFWAPMLDGEGSLIAELERVITEANEVLSKIYSKSETNGLLAEKVPSTRTINGHTLSDDVMLSAGDVNALEIGETYSKTQVDNMINTVKNEAAYDIKASLNETDYKLKIKLYGKNGTELTSKHDNEIDFPIESMVVGAAYDSVKKEIKLTLKNNEELTVPVSELISGLVKTTDIATEKTAGIVRVKSPSSNPNHGNGEGITIYSDGENKGMLRIDPATPIDIDTGRSNLMPLSVSKISYAVRKALANPTERVGSEVKILDWTKTNPTTGNTYQEDARNTLGISKYTTEITFSSISSDTTPLSKNAENARYRCAVDTNYIPSDVTVINIAPRYGRYDVTKINGQCFRTMPNIKEVYLPKLSNSADELTIDGMAFADCTNLEKFIAYGNIGGIGGQTFRNCSKCMIFDFSGCIKVPNLTNSNAFDGINANAKIIVPKNLIITWSTSTNWLTHIGKLRTPDNCFVINMTPRCLADEGMTWGMWVNSEYNTEGFAMTVESPMGNVAYGNYWVHNSEGVPVHLQDTISIGESYSIY